MRFTSAVFILIQIFLSLVTECLKVEGVFFPQRRRQSIRQQVDNDNNILKNMFSHHPTNRKKVVLMCHNKNYLVMVKDKLQGSVNPKFIKKFGKFELQSFGVGIMKIFNVKARKFIAVDKKGRAYATRNNTLDDTLFKETQKNSLFVTYHSLVHRTLENGQRRKWYLAIKKNGRFKRPSKTYSRHRSIEFLPRDWGKYKIHLVNSR